MGMGGLGEEKKKETIRSHNVFKDLLFFFSFDDLNTVECKLLYFSEFSFQFHFQYTVFPLVQNGILGISHSFLIYCT